MPFQKIETDATPHPRKWWHIPLLLLLIVGTVYIARDYQGKKSGGTFQKTEGAIFGTFYHITYESNASLQSGIDLTLKQIDNSLSPFNAQSVITAINNNSSTKADQRLIDVVSLAQKVSEETDGAFDITVAPLVNAWGFGFKNANSVEQSNIDSLLQFVGYQKIQISGDQIVKQDPRTMLDCSAIAKGYAVDAVAKYLGSEGVKNYMVEIGGEVIVAGHNPSGESWRIAINKPVDDSLAQNTEYQEVLPVTDIAMATSGNYRNFYVKNNKKYAHTIDPRTGCPVQHNILSATVLASTCAEADAFATAFMVQGLEKAQATLKRRPELKAYIIYQAENGELSVWHTANLKLE